MIRSLAISLIALLLIGPGSVLAKAEIQRPAATDSFTHYRGTTPDPWVDSYRASAPATAMVEVTEVVDQEVLELAPPVDAPEEDECAKLIQPFGRKDMHRFVSEWSGFWRLSRYNPSSNAPNGGGLLSNLGLRYKIPDKNAAYHAIAYELSYNWWNGTTAELSLLEAAIRVYACSSPVFRAKHHPYYGVGFGNAEVKRLTGANAGTFNANTFSIVGGIEFPGRRVDFDVFTKYIYSPDTRYNLDDLQFGLGVVYTFGRGN